MLHRPDLRGTTSGSPILDDYYFYLAVGDLTPKGFWGRSASQDPYRLTLERKLPPKSEQEKEQKDNE